MIIAISVITRTGYNEQIRLDLCARYIRFLLYIIWVFSVYFFFSFDAMPGLSVKQPFTMGDFWLYLENFSRYWEMFFKHRCSPYNFLSKWLFPFLVLLQETSNFVNLKNREPRWEGGVPRLSHKTKASCPYSMKVPWKLQCDRIAFTQVSVRHRKWEILTDTQTFNGKLVSWTIWRKNPVLS